MTIKHAVEKVKEFESKTPKGEAHKRFVTYIQSKDKPQENIENKENEQ